MSSTLIGPFPNGVTLTDPSQSPVTVASNGSISSLPSDFALYGASKFGQPDYHFPWDITNLGRITGSGTLSTGILLESGGTVRNQLGGYISGGRQGVSVARLAGTVTNSGSIAGTATLSTGVYLHAGGTVTNLGAIRGVKAGVQIAGAANGAVANYGTIQSTDTFFGYAVILNAAVGNRLSNSAIGYIGEAHGFAITSGTAVGAATIENSGVIHNGIALSSGGIITNGTSGSAGGLITGGGIDIGNDPGSVVNYGSITSGFLYGVALRAGGSFRNAQAGAIVAPSKSAGDGVIIAYGPGTVGNLGTIAVYGTDGGSAVFLGDGGTVVNGSASDAAAVLKDDLFSKDIGIEVRGLPGRVANFGSITGGYGAFLRAGGTVVNAAPGAYVRGQYFSAVIYDKSAKSAITNFGTMKAVGSNNNPGFGSISARIDGNGTITNGTNADTSALITADMSGVTVAGAGTVTFGALIDGSGTIANFGTIDALQSAVVVEGGGSVRNGSTADHLALVTAAGSGVIIGSGASTASFVSNFGRIAASGTAGIGVSLVNARNNTLTNGGTISGGGTAVAFGAGDDRLVVDAGARFKGVVIGGGGSNEIDFNKTGTVRLNPEYSGFSIVRLDNGGADSLTLREEDFVGIGGGVITVYGGHVASTVNAAALSTKHRLDYFGTVGKDKVSGGAGNDAFSFTAGALTAADTISGNGGNDSLTVTTGGTVGIAGVSGIETFRLASKAADRLSLTNSNFAGVAGHIITVTGGNAGGTVDASQLSSANRVVLHGGNGPDKLTGGAGNDRFSFAAAALTFADRINGGGGADELDITTGGIAGMSGVSGIETIRLSNAGADAILLGNANFVGTSGSAITVIGGSAGNVVISQAVTAPHRLNFVGGAGPDLFLAGSGNDTFKFAAASLSAADAVQGGNGSDRLIMTTSGTVAAAGVSGVETYVLANGGADTLTLTNANFAGVTGNAITVMGGNAGNRISEVAVAAADLVTMKGGAGGDTLIAGRHAVMTGDGGADVFELTTPNASASPNGDRMTDFAHGTDKLAFSNAGFHLGLTKASTTPQKLPALLFSTKTDGSFDKPGERFAYSKSTGALFFDADGSGASRGRQLIATLADRPTLTAGDLFFVV